MSFDFDAILNRRGTGSNKWEQYPADVLPMWVADMDFRSPEPILRALHERVELGTFGYSSSPHTGLTTAVSKRLKRLYGWEVPPEAVIPVPSLVTGINMVCRAFGRPGDHVLTPTPAYPPFLSAPAQHQEQIDQVELRLEQHERTIRYSLDLDRFAAAFHERTRILLLSSPHNPVGLTYDAATLRAIADICARNDTLICSDEIHSDLLLGDTTHTPLASLDPAIADRTITMISPSKTFNLPGLGCGIVIITNPERRKQFQKANLYIVPHVNALGLAAARAAFEACEDWLLALRAYLTANRDLLVQFVAEQLPSLRTTVPEATYLAWLDCREAGIPGDPFSFFLERARVALSDGKTFGKGGEGFVRLNFGCPRAQLLEALERMRAALATLP